MRANKRPTSTTRTRSTKRVTTTRTKASSSSTTSILSNTRPSSTSTRVAPTAAVHRRMTPAAVVVRQSDSNSSATTAKRRTISTVSVQPFTPLHNQLKTIHKKMPFKSPSSVSSKTMATYVSDSPSPDAYSFASEPINFSIRVQKTDEVYPVVGYEGETIMDAALRHDVPIRFNCYTTMEQEAINGIGPNCGNCFGVFPKGFVHKLPEPESDEELQMFMVQRNRLNSFNDGFRFLCVTELIPDYEGVQIFIPHDTTPADPHTNI